MVTFLWVEGPRDYTCKIHWEEIMKKQVITLAVALASVAALTGCKKDKIPADWKVDNSGQILNIQCWNDEFRGFFNKYITDEGKALLAEGKIMEKTKATETKEGLHMHGIPVKFIETPNADNAYQNALDLVLGGQSKAKAEDKVDFFLAEADYIQKYALSDLTQDVKTIGVTDMSQAYQYTIDACSNSKGVVKGASFQCAPSGMIYNRIIAKDVLGTDDPVEVQKAVDTWDHFTETAAKAKAKGYYMTACDAETYRLYSNNMETAWVDSKGNIKIPNAIEEWMVQTEDYVKKGYTIPADVWSGDKTALVTEDTSKSDKKAAYAGKAFCCFGPAWYYNFCMSAATPGDWGLCAGPKAHFYGGTWIMAAAGSDNTDLVAEVMNTFLNDESVNKLMITEENQFTNNKKVNKEVADGGRENEFLGGQNDTAIFCGMADNIKFRFPTIYDQACNEKIQGKFREYLTKDVDSKEKAVANFYDAMLEAYPNLKAPK